MARGYSSAASERTDKMRAKAEALLTKAADIDTKDAMKAAKAARIAAEKAEREKKDALKDPAKLAEAVKITLDPGKGRISFSFNGKDLELLTPAGANISRFGNSAFDGVFKELDATVKGDFVRQLKEDGVDEKTAKKAVDMIAQKASEALFGKIDIKDVLQNPAAQDQITKAFEDLNKYVSRAKEASAAAREYSSSPSDDGSYNLEAFAARRALASHVAYVNRLRDEISSVDIGIQYGEKPVNKQTEDWIEDLVYGGALDKAYSKHRDLFVD